MTALSALKGVGPQLSNKLQRLQLYAVTDLLFHLPIRYQDRTQLVTINQLIPATEQLVEGTITGSGIRFGKRRSLLCTLEDQTGSLTVRLFHFNKSQQAALQNGRTIRCFGETRRGPSGLEMVHPEYQLRDSHQPPPPLDQRLTPIYPATEGVRQRTLFSLTTQALQVALATVEELLPASSRQGLPSLPEALQTLHRPTAATSKEQLHRCHERIALEELLAHHLSLSLIRLQHRTEQAIPLPADQPQVKQFLTTLPFTLTGAQQRALNEIFKDLSHPYPMQRLLQGDVGSGKTIVALCAALHTAESGYQVALMAPTELLASQHHQVLNKLLAPLKIEAGLLTGSMKAAPRRAIIDQLESGSCTIVVGTHALFQKQVHFNKLALVIIDEQHRFGVDQRYALQQKGESGNTIPHQLIMTATPIPRTLAMTFYADLDSTIIDELPPGRTPIKTVTIPESRRNEILQRVHANCQQGKQVYWVCPLIEESEALQCQAATESAEQIQQQLSDLKVGLVHGKMGAADKESVMEQFHRGEIQILVATTVIEVGVDVPNASLMIIESAERLGLSQLHQLRGRVGRGAEASSCVLMYRAPLSPVATERLKTIRESTDGFEIARKDLEMRGPGELLGRRQTGALQLKIADLTQDQHLIPLVEQVAPDLLNHAPEQVKKLIQRWIPEGERYRSVG
ncbi:MAG: ATP-dependent DNA helicase RecG [Gammaproteobacteria bacterium]|nr:ATP-dependent DNA helicase RecG [Gammaproteobacteria bacterium]